MWRRIGKQNLFHAEAQRTQRRNYFWLNCMHWKFITFILLLTVLFIVNLYADIQLEATVDSRNVTNADSIVYKLRISSDTSDLPYPELPDFKGFKVVSRNIPVTITQMVNNQVTYAQEYGFVLVPQVESGQLTIAPITVNYKGKTYYSNTIEINVTKDTTVSTLPFDGIISARTGNNEYDKQLKGKLFLYVDVDKKEAYVGEQVNIAYYLYNKQFDLGGLSLANEPDFSGVLKESLSDIFQTQRWNWKEKTINSEKFYVLPIRSYALFPTKPGAIKLGAMELKSSLRVKSSQRRSPIDNDFFRTPFDDKMLDQLFNDDIFGTNHIPVVLSSNDIEINVLPIPEEGKPADYNGTVGNFDLKMDVDKKEVSENDLITLKLEVDGKGNPDAIVEPKLNGLEDFQIYQSSSKVTDKGLDADGKVKGKKTFEFVLRPLKPGALKIPAIAYSVFNPFEKKFKTLSTEEVNVNVKPGKAETVKVIEAPGTVATEGKEIKALGKDIRFIKEGGYTGGREHRYLYENPIFIFVQFGPVILVIFSVVYRKRKDRLESDVSFARKRIARSSALKKLSKAKQLLDVHKAEEFYNELSQGLREYFGNKFNLPSAGLTAEDICSKINECENTESLRADVRKVFELCDFAKFSSASSDNKEMESAFQLAEDVILQSEKVLR